MVMHENRVGTTKRGRLSVGRHIKKTSKIFIPYLSAAFLILLLTVPMTVFIWLLFFTSTFSVQAISVLDAREDTTVSARKIAEEFINNISFSKSIFLVQSDLIENALVSKLPQIHSALVTRKLPGTLKIVLQEKKPALVLYSGRNYYFVDQQGIPYEEASIERLPGLILPTIKNNDEQASVTLGVPVVDESFVEFVQILQTKLPETINAQIAEIRIPSLATREVHFRLNNNWLLRFDSTRDGPTQLNVLQRVVNEVISPADQQVLEYIDLRIKDRVYYRTLINRPSK